MSKLTLFIEPVLFGWYAEMQSGPSLVQLPPPSKPVAKAKLGVDGTFELKWAVAVTQAAMAPWFWVSGQDEQRMRFYRVGMDWQPVAEHPGYGFFIDLHRSYPLISFFPGETIKQLGDLLIDYRYEGG